jgi:hypothetical protein
LVLFSQRVGRGLAAALLWCVWQLISAHFGSLFWPTLRGDGF